MEIEMEMGIGKEWREGSLRGLQSSSFSVSIRARRALGIFQGGFADIGYLEIGGLSP